MTPARSVRQKHAGGEGQARTKFTAFVPGRYKATTGIVPVRTDFRSGTMTAYVGRQRHAGAAMRGMLDYVFGRQEENNEITKHAFHAGSFTAEATMTFEPVSAGGENRVADRTAN